jgi:hypothetical protein
VQADGASPAGYWSIVRREQLLAAAAKTIPDVIAPDLRVLFCGIVRLFRELRQAADPFPGPP